MIPRDHQHLEIDVSIVMDEKVNKLDHEDLILAEGKIKRGDAYGIHSLRSSKVCSIFEALYRTKINAECSH